MDTQEEEETADEDKSDLSLARLPLDGGSWAYANRFMKRDRQVSVSDTVGGRVCACANTSEHIGAYLCCPDTISCSNKRNKCLMTMQEFSPTYINRKLGSGAYAITYSITIPTVNPYGLNPGTYAAKLKRLSMTNVNYTAIVNGEAVRELSVMRGIGLGVYTAGACRAIKEKKPVPGVQAANPYEGLGYYIVMDMGDMALHTFMGSARGKSITIEQITDISFQLFFAVAAMHRMGVCHLDMKPDNVVVFINQNTIDIKIIDYGLSWTRWLPVMASGNYAYTSPYRPPEYLLWGWMFDEAVKDGKKKIWSSEMWTDYNMPSLPERKAGDVWATGLIVLEMLYSKYGNINTCYTMAYTGWEKYRTDSAILAQQNIPYATTTDQYRFLLAMQYFGVPSPMRVIGKKAWDGAQGIFTQPWIKAVSMVKNSGFIWKPLLTDQSNTMGWSQLQSGNSAPIWRDTIFATMDTKVKNMVDLLKTVLVWYPVDRSTARVICDSVVHRESLRTRMNISNMPPKQTKENILKSLMYDALTQSDIEKAYPCNPPKVQPPDLSIYNTWISEYANAVYAYEVQRLKNEDGIFASTEATTTVVRFENIMYRIMHIRNDITNKQSFEYYCAGAHGIASSLGYRSCLANTVAEYSASPVLPWNKTVDHVRVTNVAMLILRYLDADLNRPNILTMGIAMAHELGIFSRISGAGTKNVCWLMGIITARMLLRADTFLLPMDVVAFAIIIATLHITYGETHFVEIMKVLPVPIFQDYINKIKILGNLYSSIYTLALDIKGNVTPP